MSARLTYTCLGTRVRVKWPCSHNRLGPTFMYSGLQHHEQGHQEQHSVSPREVCDWHTEWQARLVTVVLGRGQVGTAQCGVWVWP